MTHALPPDSPAEHLDRLAEFVRLESELGGPDPHLATVGAMLTGDAAEDIWRCGLYASAYNVPTAEAVWTAWPFARVLEEVEDLPGWVYENWNGLAFRRERRAVRTREKYSRCLVSIADWVAKRDTFDWWTEDNYDAAWKSSSEIYGLGRYVQLKFLEALRRYCGGAFDPHDIRPAGGKTPRACLANIYPEHRGPLLGNDNRDNLLIADMCAANARDAIEERNGWAPDYFVLQVVLCEYGKVAAGRQYPGRTHDTELRYYRDVREYWGDGSSMLDARLVAFDPICLGERNGWWRQREELSRTLPDYGYVWSDALYSYYDTTDLGDPVPRAEATYLPSQDELVELRPSRIVVDAPKKTRMTLRPVYVHPETGAALYQAGARDLVATDLSTLLGALHGARIGLVVNASDRVVPDIGLYMPYRQMPFGDNGQFAEHMPGIDRVVNEAARALADGRSVLVHCFYGTNRSGLVNALIIRALENKTGAEALTKLRHRRKGACKGNRHFETYLRELPRPA
jgi:hypothetical protein